MPSFAQSIDHPVIERSRDIISKCLFEVSVHTQLVKNVKILASSSAFLNTIGLPVLKQPLRSPGSESRIRMDITVEVRVEAGRRRPAFLHTMQLIMLPCKSLSLCVANFVSPISLTDIGYLSK